MVRHSILLTIATCFAALDASAAETPVRVWQDSIRLPTYRDEAAAARDFSLFSSDPGNYPYPVRNRLSQQPRDRSWRTLNLENEYLMCRVLPDLGGHLYSCRDKRNQREMFYANPVIKPGMEGLRGAWNAIGIESNFPIGHARDSASPVDFALRQYPDGSAGVVVEDTDRITGMEWRAEFVLRPASTVLEERVTLYNRTPARWPFYWWANADITLDDPGARVILPAQMVSSHQTPREILKWPLDWGGKDPLLVANFKSGGGWFSYGSRESFFGLYKPASRSGVVHVADPQKVPGKKIWIWGADGDEQVHRELTDNFWSYVEIQAGVFQNQDILHFLEPGQSVTFSENWIPIYDLGGLSRATADVVLNLERTSQGGLRIEIDPTHPLTGAAIRVLNAGRSVFDTRADLEPAKPFAHAIDKAEASPYTVQIADSQGRLLLEHTENHYDALPPDPAKLGVLPAPDFGSPDRADFFLIRGEYNELQNQRWFAWSDYTEGLRRYPTSLPLKKAAGRLAFSLQRFEEAARLLAAVLAAHPEDDEARYYLGAAQAMLGRDYVAGQTLSAIKADSPFRAPAALELTQRAARARDDRGALAYLKPLLASGSAPARVGAIEVALLRRSGAGDQAVAEFKRWRETDPADAFLRFEGIRLGFDDPAFWTHLAADSERVLNLVDEYLALGMEQDALLLLEHDYPAFSSEDLEPGAVPPTLDPMVNYYRAYCHARLGQDYSNDLRKASAGFTSYLFPHRASSWTVLNAAVQFNPSDALAHLLLGRLYMNALAANQAIAEWQSARELNPALPELLPDLARALIDLQKNLGEGLEVARQALKRDPSDQELQKLVTRAASVLAAAPRSAAASAASLSPRKAPDSKAKTEAAEKNKVSTAPSAPVAPAPPLSDESRIKKAEEAMLAAAAGRIDEATRTFNAGTFSTEKQPEDVRVAYIEVKLQSLIALAHGGQCEQALDRLFYLGNEDPGLPFTLYGFEPFMRRAHFQYFEAGIEVSCGKEKSARKRWERIEKMSESASSPEYVFPILAAAKLDARQAAPRVAAALESIKTALSDANPGSKPALLFAEGMLLGISGQTGRAAENLQQAAKSGDVMVTYLAIAGLREMLRSAR